MRHTPAMQIGNRSELAVIGLEGRVEERDDHVVATWGALPDFAGGNKLVFAAPPGPGDLERWEALFADALPAAPHRSFAWEGAEGETAPFVAAGYELSRCAVLVTSSPPTDPPRASGRVEVRALDGPAEWRAVIDGARSDFGARRTRRFRALVEAGHGLWFGAFLDGRYVAGLGIFGAGGLARYQEVVTLPDFRGRGIGGRLVAEAGRQAMERLAARRLVIVAEQGSSAERIYRAAGFEPVGQMYEVVRMPGGPGG